MLGLKLRRSALFVLRRIEENNFGMLRFVLLGLKLRRSAFFVLRRIEENNFGMLRFVMLGLKLRRSALFLLRRIEENNFGKLRFCDVGIEATPVVTCRNLEGFNMSSRRCNLRITMDFFTTLDRVERRYKNITDSKLSYGLEISKS